MQKPPYYFQHEAAYKAIQKKGASGWQTTSLTNFRNPETEVVVQPLIEKYCLHSSPMKALDLGCGSGPTSHLLHDLGFEVLGIDVSPTAIAMAQEIAARLEKNIEFRCGDVLHLEMEARQFDVIYDSRCLHCIVDESDRAQTFTAIKNSLTATGIFIVDTMAFRESADLCRNPAPLRFDKDFILWHKTSRNSYQGVAELDGNYWCPQRRIYPAETILTELRSSGFRVVEFKVDDQGPSQVYMLRAVCFRE